MDLPHLKTYEFKFVDGSWHVVEIIKYVPIEKKYIELFRRKDFLKE